MLTHNRLMELMDGELYSGRGMMGAKCWSVTTCGGQSPFRLLSEIILECEDVNEAAELLRRARTDDMGTGTVIYWPSVKLAASDE